jgi:hypothetical protein
MFGSESHVVARAVPVHVAADPDRLGVVLCDDDRLVHVKRPAVVSREVVHVRRVRNHERVEVALAEPLFGPLDPRLVLRLGEDIEWHGPGSIG